MTLLFSGVQPTGSLHLGNYLGAVRNWVDIQYNYDRSLFCIVDLHAITVPYDRDSLKKDILETAFAYLASGIDPSKSDIFIQSSVPEHAELTWLLSCITPAGWLNRMTQFKDKTSFDFDSVKALYSKDKAKALQFIDDNPRIVQSIDINGNTIVHAIANHNIFINNKEFLRSFENKFDKASNLDNFLSELKEEIASKEGIFINPCEEVLNELILKGVDINACNMDGKTALFVAYCNSDKKFLIDFLTKKGAKINTSSKIKNSKNVSLGIYSYPVLMAADILLYKSTHVPVGEDQKQHLELARDISGSFNSNYCKDYFNLPIPVIQEQSSRVMSLRDGTKKMSKSEKSDQSRINLSDSNDDILKKIKRAKTDSIREIYYDKVNRPEISNLLEIHASLIGEKIEKVENKFRDSGSAKFKQELADALIWKISPIRSKIIQLRKEEAYVLEILEKGKDKVREIASQNLKEIKKILGFI